MRPRRRRRKRANKQFSETRSREREYITRIKEQTDRENEGALEREDERALVRALERRRENTTITFALRIYFRFLYQNFREQYYPKRQNRNFRARLKK